MRRATRRRRDPAIPGVARGGAHDAGEGSLMRRRRILAGLVLSLAAPLASEAQQAGRMYRIGYLLDGKPPDQTPSPPLRALEETLRDLGYVEGRNLVFERRFAALKYDRLPDLAAELVRLKLDVIVTGGNPAIAALKRATTIVPIVMLWAEDPVGAGLVTSLARPGGTSRARA